MLGFTAAAGGDVNGDGYGDVVVGAFRYDAPDADEGAVFVFLGGAAGVPDGSPASAIVLEGDQPGALLGYDAGAGDVNGDGYADVFAGAAAYDGPEADEGLAVVFLGNAGAGRAARPLQQRPGDGATVSAWGRSGVGDGFRVELRASHPEGAGRVATEVETCPPGAAFGGPACSASTSAWVSVGGGAPEARIAQDVAGLGANTLYRWRARTLYAPAAGPIPPRPAHGPWRRFGVRLQ
jgi:hypothetical protein